MKLLFTGDINFRGKDNVTFEESEKILTEVLPYINDVDFVIPNLECPLADINMHEPIKKSGPNLICTPENIRFLKALNADAVTISNNHIERYNASGNFKLVSCEAHLSQLKEVLRILHNEETESAQEWAEKIKELGKMLL